MTAPAERVVRMNQAQRAYELKLAGVRYRDIAKELGVSVGTVVNRINEFNADVLESSAREWRAQEHNRLERLWEALDDGIEKGDAQAVSAAVRVSERRSKLLGLDARASVDDRLEERTDVEAHLVAGAVVAVADALDDALTELSVLRRRDLREYANAVSLWYWEGGEGERPPAPAVRAEPDPWPYRGPVPPGGERAVVSGELMPHPNREVFSDLVARLERLRSEPVDAETLEDA